MRRTLYVFTLSFLGLLIGCSTTVKDGPPRFHVDVSKIPDAIPKVEPLSKLGNKSYVVFGKRYEVMQSSLNYEELGTASWYGTKFDSNRTSNGERYNMLAMTAAHKSLPLPTYVEVTNLGNHKKIIVKVNDRGPFIGNRLIDLSYVAAKKLDMLGHGTTHVRVKAIDPTHFNKSIKVHEHGGMFWAKKNIYLQVASFANKNHADQLKQRLTTLIKLPIQVMTTFKPHLVYRVQVGPIPDKNKIAQISDRLKSAGFKNFLIQAREI